MEHSLISCRDLQARVALGRSTIYRLISKGQFPRPVKIGGKAVRWVVSEIDAWVTEQAASR